MIFLLYILRIIYPLCSGMKDAILWSHKGVNAFPFDEHVVILIERISITVFVLFMIIGHKLQWFGLVDLLIVELCYILSFPFFQAGMYYQSRHWIDKAYKGFWSDSSTSSAKLNFSFKVRSLLFLLSILILIIYEIYT